MSFTVSAAMAAFPSQAGAHLAAGPLVLYMYVLYVYNVKRFVSAGSDPQPAELRGDDLLVRRVALQDAGVARELLHAARRKPG